MKNLVVRTLSGLVLAAVVLGAIVWSQWSFGALLAALLVGGMYEFYTLAGKQGNAPQRVVGLVAGVVLFVLNFAFVSDDIEILGDARQAFGCGLAFLLLLLPAMFICELYRRGENPASGIGTTIMGICYVALPLSLMCYIPIVGSDTWNPWIMVAYIFIIWANDVFAYLVGMSVGRHRLCERLSPKNPGRGSSAGSPVPSSWASWLHGCWTGICGFGPVWHWSPPFRACWATWWSRCSSGLPALRIRGG